MHQAFGHAVQAVAFRVSENRHQDLPMLVANIGNPCSSACCFSSQFFCHLSTEEKEFILTHINKFAKKF